MTDPVDPQFLALLVHRRLVPRELMAAAMASGQPLEHLLSNGVHREQWDEWVATEAGLRPRLTRYELHEALGTGGTARVFRATDRTDGSTVALKVLLPELHQDAAAVAKFVAEAKLLAELESEHIVRGYRVAREGGTIYCAMEWIDGECVQDVLSERMADDEPFGEEEALQVVVQVAKALEYLHGRGLVHRDVKPGNVMLIEATDDEPLRAVLIDLGFAIESVGDSDTDASDSTAGTVQYISPEQARGGGLDVRADIYSLGATLYHLVTGELPFAGRSPDEVMAKQVQEALSGERIRARNLSPQLHYFIEKMMAKEREIRFQSPADLVRDVERHLANLERERQAEADASGGLRGLRRGRPSGDGSGRRPTRGRRRPGRGGRRR